MALCVTQYLTDAIIHCESKALGRDNDDQRMNRADLRRRDRTVRAGEGDSPSSEPRSHPRNQLGVIGDIPGCRNNYDRGGHAHLLLNPFSHSGM